MGRAQRHWEPPWGTPGRSGGQPASTPGVGAGVMAGWHPGVEQGDSRLAPWGRGRRGLRAQRRCKNPAGGPCSRPSEGAPRLTGSGLRQAPSAQQPAGSSAARRKRDVRSENPRGKEPPPRLPARPLPHSSPSEAASSVPSCPCSPAVPATRPSAPRGRGLELLCPGPSGAARHLAGTQTGGTRDRLGGDLSRAQGSEAGIPKPQMFGSSNWK